MKNLCAVYMVLILFISGVSQSPAQDQEKKQAETGNKENKTTVLEDTIVETEHLLGEGSEQIAYRARAGELIIDPEDLDQKGRFFFVAYEKEEGKGTRPVTFAFNGGPGASSAWLHIGAMGPKIIDLNDDGTPKPPPAGLVHNKLTWLHFTDLVFIDPVGTGYSRPVSGENNATAFWDLERDVSSVAEFIRYYLTIRKRWSSPKFLVGESYGTTRAAALSSFLVEKHGIRVNGILQISPVLDYATIAFSTDNNLPYVLFLPSFAAAAAFHRERSAPEDLQGTLKPAEDFAQEKYLVTLFQASNATDVRKTEVAEQTSRLTGLDLTLVRNNRSRISPRLFFKELLKTEGLIVGRMDSTITGVDPDVAHPYTYFDPSLDPLLGPFSTAMNSYVLEELQYFSKVPYKLLNSEVSRRWNWGRSLKGPMGQGYVNAADDLKQAMTQNPFLKVFMACGYYDLATPYWATVYTVRQMHLDDRIRPNLIMAFYRAGHMIYLKSEERMKLFEDVQEFYEAALP